MRILVTGASGFIGRPVLSSLVRQEFEVIALSRSTLSTSVANVVQWECTDLMNDESVRAVIAKHKPEILLHLAWDTTHGEYWHSTKNMDFLSASIRLARNFVENGGSRIVVAGTSAEYAWDSASPLNEQHSPECWDSLYSRCKNSLRICLERWAGQEGVSLAWARIFCPFGEFENPAKLAPRIVKQLVTGQKVHFDSALEERDFLHVDDLADAFVSLIESDYDGVINLASGEGVSVRQFLNIFAKALNARDQLTFEPVDNDLPKNQVFADTATLRNTIGWSPSHTLDERIHQTADWWLETLNNHRHEPD